jgi:hypothetical protein
MAEINANAVAVALTALVDAHKEYDDKRDAARANDAVSWDYDGHEYRQIEEAHARLDVALGGYIDARVRATLDAMGIHGRKT